MIVRICVKNRRLKDTSSFIPLRIAYPTGMRPGEVFGLTWDDIDFVNKTITHSFSGRIWRTSGILCMLCGLFAESTAAFVLYIVSIIAAIIISILHSYLFYKKKI